MRTQQDLLLDSTPIPLEHPSPHKFDRKKLAISGYDWCEPPLHFHQPVNSLHVSIALETIQTQEDP